MPRLLPRRSCYLEELLGKILMQEQYARALPLPCPATFPVAGGYPPAARRGSGPAPEKIQDRFVVLV